MKNKKVISLLCLSSLLFANTLSEAKNLKQNDTDFSKIFENKNGNKNKKVKYFLGSLKLLFNYYLANCFQKNLEF